METIIGDGVEGGPLILRARLADSEGTPITQAAVSSIQYEVWNTSPPLGRQPFNWRSQWIAVDPPVKITNATSLTVADVVFDTLQPWDVDDVGYNFRGVIPPEALGEIDIDDFPKGQWVRVDVLVTPTSGDPFVVPFWVGLAPSLFGKTVP